MSETQSKRKEELENKFYSVGLTYDESVEYGFILTGNHISLNPESYLTY